MYHHNKMIAVLLGAVVFLPLVATGAEAPAKASAAKSPTPVTAIAQPRYEARTQSKPMKQGAVNAGGMLWQCRGTRCTATQPHGTPADACKALAREVGTLASFIFASKTFSSAELAQCRPPVRATTQNDTRSVARADKSKAESDKAPMTAPGVMPKAPQGFGIRTEPPDLRVTSLSQAGATSSSPSRRPKTPME